MSVPPSIRRVLLILEDREERESAKDALRLAGWEVHSRDSPIGATVEIVRSRIDAVALDVDFDVMSGDRFAELIRKNDRLDHVGLVLVSNRSAHEAEELATRVGADAGLSRTTPGRSLSEALEVALERRRRRASNRPPPPTGSTTVLVLRSERFALPLVEGRQLIGRDASCRFVLNHASVSRKHAAIEVRGAAATVVDLGSHNGTHVNDEPVSRERPLELGDVIRFGQEELVLGLQRQLSRETIEME